MKPGFFLWLVTILSFIWGVAFSFIAYTAASCLASTAARLPSFGAEIWSFMGFVVCAISLIIRGFEVI